MSKIFSNLKPHNSVGRNGFDLSRRSVFSAKCGQILPVFCQATLPDSEYQIDLKQLLRTQPLQTAAFTGFSVNYDFYFVPNNFGYSSFNEFISQRNDDSHVGQPSLQVVPTFQFQTFLECLLPCAVYDYIVQDRFSPPQMQGSNYVTTSEPHFCIVSQNIPWASLSLEVIRSLDMFGYGNYLPFIKLYADAVIREVELSQGTITSYFDFMSKLATIHQSSVGDFYNLYDTIYDLMVDSETNNSFTFSFKSFPNIKPTLWPFLAYNKGFYEFYRNCYYDSSFNTVLCGGSTVFSLSWQYVQLFNYDDFIDQGFSLGSSSNQAFFARILAMLVPKNHLYKKDLLTGVLPSTQFGDVSVMLDNRDWLNLYTKVTASGFSSGVRGVYTSDPIQSDSISKLGLRTGGSTQNVDSVFRFDPALAISVLEQRRADAMQRFKERLMRAGNKVDDVFKAHGWNAPKSYQDVSPIFLGTFDGRLDINTVAATTNASNQELGQLAANGTAVVNGSKIHFKSHDFGVIVGVFYIVKDAEYDAYGVERQHCLTDPFDYPYPELQNISLHPIDTLEVSAYLRMTGVTKLFSGDILGYLPRYMEYKTALDKVHGEFHSAPFDPSNNGTSPTFRSYGVFSDWVTPREDLNIPTSVAFLYQSPNVSDNIFLQKSTALQSSDPFLVNCLFDVMAVEPVSVIGLPI